AGLPGCSWPGWGSCRPDTNAPSPLRRVNGIPPRRVVKTAAGSTCPAASSAGTTSRSGTPAATSTSAVSRTDRRRADPPGQSVTVSTIGGHNIQIGSAGRDVLIWLDRPGYRLEFLTPAPPVLPRPSRSHKRPSYLLDPASQVVPYRHRVRAEERLR